MESNNEKEIRSRTDKDRICYKFDIQVNASLNVDHIHGWNKWNHAATNIGDQMSFSHEFCEPEDVLLGAGTPEAEVELAGRDDPIEEAEEAVVENEQRGRTGDNAVKRSEASKPINGGGNPVAGVDDSSRQSWSSHLDFVITLLGFAVGLGNIWRFPYLCFQHGGGAFLVPYLIFMVGCGAPLFFLEISLGQFSQRGAIKCWNILPVFRGIGIASTLVVFYCNTYYIIILAWAAFYLFAAFNIPLGFSTCNNPWNTPSCYEVSQLATESGKLGVNESLLLNFTSSVDEFWIRRVLQRHLSSGVEDPGSIVLHLAGTLFLVWVLCFLCVFKGIRVSGKIVYFTALFPYVIITCMIIRGATLEGSSEGIKFYLKPDFSKLATSEVWVDAGTQVFFSYAVCLGVLPTLGSFNDFNNNVLRDAILISVANPATSLFAGFGVFSILGHLAHVTNLPISDVTDSGPGLVFKTYPVAISLLPWPNFWAILFFFMIILLGFDSQFSAVESFVTTITDLWPYLQRSPNRRIGFTLIVCLSHFLIGLSMVTQGGAYVFEIWNTYSASGKNLLVIAFFELIALSWVYGAGKYRKNIVSMIGYESWILYWFQFCWSILSPLLIFGLLTFEVVDYIRGEGQLTYGSYVYPLWAEWIGWAFELSVFVCVPLCAFYHLALKRALRSCAKSDNRKQWVHQNGISDLAQYRKSDEALRLGRKSSRHVRTVATSSRISEVSSKTMDFSNGSHHIAQTRKVSKSNVANASTTSDSYI